MGLPPHSDVLDDVGFDGWIPINGVYVEEPARIRALVRWCLRDLGWCQLEADSLYIHFGYDFYLYAGGASPLNQAIEAIHDSGLFADSCPSSYCTQYARTFTLQLHRVGDTVIEKEVALANLDGAGIAELWPAVPSLAGYSFRPVTEKLAEIVFRYVELAFDFEVYEYTLERDVNE